MIGLIGMGIVTLALQGFQHEGWIRCKALLSLGMSAAAVLLFILGLQPYAAVFAFVLLGIKAFMWIKMMVTRNVSRL